MADAIDTGADERPVLRTAPGLAWVVERDGILLIQPTRGMARFIGYPHAALWDLLSRGATRERAAVLLAQMVSLSTGAADRLVREGIDLWVREGILIAE